LKILFLLSHFQGINIFNPRGLFPEKCFIDVQVNGFLIKRLKRGVSSAVDSFLDLLHLGVCDALQKQYVFYV